MIEIIFLEMTHFLWRTARFSSIWSRFGWPDVSLKEDLERTASISVTLENNANLCSFAERVYQHSEEKLFRIHSWGSFFYVKEAVLGRYFSFWGGI
ncbi:hypothetical protein [Domibacillus tundrae]|uniref:hypothetical protein n=1 Tax=Domibacillus tundrae TaxID=1587527 RepID=UPI003398BCEA